MITNKVTFFGPPKSGKTRLRLALAKNEFTSEPYKMTIGCDFSLMQSPQQKVPLWDFSGEELGKSYLTNLYLKDTEIFMLCVNGTQAGVFPSSEVSNICKSILEKFDFSGESKKIKFFIISTHADLPNHTPAEELLNKLCQVNDLETLRKHVELTLNTSTTPPHGTNTAFLKQELISFFPVTAEPEEIEREEAQRTHSSYCSISCGGKR